MNHNSLRLIGGESEGGQANKRAVKRVRQREGGREGKTKTLQK